ncbi:hypothetical protein LLS1_26950 [Leifsonia sp. LS1]|uniref:hypothetical protein n=1 Tax=Leifsonia sp. LS1 TaxID=2828483 RepID=UPI001CFD2CCF|nr:hypothetical protein [Leifsonia sp. LS1]GIT81026.1 hypothetical protein LLS1_26950 [Leifsonia sp. LS1]
MGVTWWWALGLFLVGAAICFARIPAAARNVLWAEDASVFVTDATKNDFFATLLTPYNGYLHFVPRVVAGLLTPTVPLDVLPLAITAAACVITAACATLIFVALRSRIPSTFVRVSVWLAVVAMPIGSVETNGNIANAHWYLLGALFAVLVTRWTSTGWAILAAAVAFFTVASDPLALVFIPLVLLHLIDRRTGLRRLIIPAAFLVGAAMQLVVIASGASLGIKAASPSVAGLARALFWRVYVAQYTGEAGSLWAFATFGTAALIVGAVVALLVVVVSIVWGRQLGGLSVISFAAAAAFFLAAVSIRWSPAYDPAIWLRWDAARYSVVPLTLMAISLGAALQTLMDRKRVAGIVGTSVVVVGLICLVLPSWSMDARIPSPQAGPWRVSLERAVERCDVPGSDDQFVRIGGVPSAGFSVRLTCEDLLSRVR